MQFIPFFQKCPEIADKETHLMVVLNEKSYGIPSGQYAFVENFCVDPKCDCRKTMINVFLINGEASKIIGTIGYGWEDVEYYAKWLHGDSELAKEMAGMYIEQGAPQSQYSLNCLELVRSNCLGDKKFINRLKEHYKYFKNSIKKEGQIVVNKIGRNEPCLCGCGKKYKKCCLNSKTTDNNITMAKNDDGVDGGEDWSEQKKRILDILQTEESCAGVSYQALGKYIDYLKRSFVYPCKVTGIEDFEWEEFYVLGPGDKNEYEELKKIEPSYTDEYELLEVLPEQDNFYGVMVRVKRISDEKEFELPLSDLKTVKRESPNTQLLDDYSVWYVNYR